MSPARKSAPRKTVARKAAPRTSAPGKALPRKPARRPRVAVLLSTWNGARWLDEQLASLAAQTGVEVELFVRDDGSTDATLAVLKRWSNVWPRLAKVRASPNLRPAASFLALLASVPGDFPYYAFCDQDDVWLPDKLARAVARLDQGSPASPRLFCSQVTCVDVRLERLGEPAVNDDCSFEHIVFENVVFGCTAVMNAAARALIVERPPRRGVIMHDWWCALVVSGFGEVVYDPEPRVLYRQHGANHVGRSEKLSLTLLRLARQASRSPRTFYRMHDQAYEFDALFGERLEDRRARYLRAVVDSKRSLVSRVLYALYGRVRRRGVIDMLAARALILAGWY